MTATTILLLAVRAGVGVVFIASGAAKARDPQEFAGTLQQLAKPDDSKSGPWFPVAVAIILLELCLGFATLLTVAPRVVNVMSVVVLGAFLLASVWAAASRPQVPCRCFGSLGQSRFSRRTIARNALLFGAACVVVVGSPSTTESLALLEVSLVAAIAGLFVAVVATGAKTVRILQRGGGT